MKPTDVTRVAPHEVACGILSYSTSLSRVSRHLKRAVFQVSVPVTNHDPIVYKCLSITCFLLKPIVWYFVNLKTVRYFFPLAHSPKKNYKMASFIFSLISLLFKTDNASPSTVTLQAEQPMKPCEAPRELVKPTPRHSPQHTDCLALIHCDM